MSTLDTLHTLAADVAAKAEAFNTAVAAARDAQINIDVRVDYDMNTPNSVISGPPKIKGVVVSSSLPLPLPTV